MYRNDYEQGIQDESWLEIYLKKWKDASDTYIECKFD